MAASGSIPDFGSQSSKAGISVLELVVRLPTAAVASSIMHSIYRAAAGIDGTSVGVRDPLLLLEVVHIQNVEHHVLLALDHVVDLNVLNTVEEHRYLSGLGDLLRAHLYGRERWSADYSVCDAGCSSLVPSA